MDRARAVAEITADLRLAGRPERAEGEKRYLRSDLEHYGVPMPAIRKIVKAWLNGHPELPREDLVAVAETLWSAPVYERRMAAVELLSMKRDVLLVEDLSLVERLIRESKTWALVDPLAIGVAGTVLEPHPEADRVLDRWAADGDFWIRRSALLAHLKPLVAGAGDFNRFGRLADDMLEEKEFFIRKAIGWVLRDTSRKRPQLVYEWIAPRTHRASGVTIREVVKWLPVDQAEKIKDGYKRKVPIA